MKWASLARELIWRVWGSYTLFPHLLRSAEHYVPVKSRPINARVKFAVDQSYGSLQNWLTYKDNWFTRNSLYLRDFVCVAR